MAGRAVRLLHMRRVIKLNIETCQLRKLFDLSRLCVGVANRAHRVCFVFKLLNVTTCALSMAGSLRFRRIVVSNMTIETWKSVMLRAVVRKLRKIAALHVLRHRVDDISRTWKSCFRRFLNRFGRTRTR